MSRWPDTSVFHSPIPALVPGPSSSLPPGNVSMRKILVVTSAYVRPSVQTLGEGEGSPKATRPGVENAIFSWREIARCFWATGVFLGGKLHDHRRSVLKKRFL